MKILNAIWFSELGSARPIGIVLGFNEATKEYTAYIGTSNGVSEELDAKHIAMHGAKFPIAHAKSLLG